MRIESTRAKLAQGVDRTVPEALAGSGKYRLGKPSNESWGPKGVRCKTTLQVTNGMDRSVAEALAGPGQCGGCSEVTYLK